MSKKPSKDLCQTLFETVGSAILVLQNGQIVDSNVAACALFNYTKRGLKGKTLLSLSPATQPDGTSSAEALQVKLDTLAIGQSVQFEWLNRDKKRRKIYTEIVLSTTEFEGTTYIQASIHNISKYKEAQETLRQSEQKLSLHIQQTPMAYIEWDTAFHVTEWNPAAEEIFGYNKAEAVGRHAAGLIVPASVKELVDQVWSNLLQQSGGTSSTNDNMTKDGRIITCEWYNTPLVSEDDQVIGVASLVQDITVRVGLEEQVRESLTRRERQVQISSQVSQEIATIINEQDLYGRLVTLIREQFGYYNVQLYQYNAQEDVLSLAAGAGRVGRQMQAENYQIARGQGAAGVAAVGTPVLYRDVAKVADWQPNPYLPDTQSEIAIPIKLGAESAEVQEAVLQYFVDDSRIEGLIVAAIDPIASASITKQALQKNMPVIACTSNLGAENQTSLIWSIEYDMGHMLGVQAGKWARQHIPKGQTLKVGVLNYRIVSQVIEREHGILQGIKDVFGDDIEIVGNETAADAIQALPVAERWLIEHPDMQMIVGINDAAALGAYLAVINAGKNDLDRFFIGGIDATDEAIAAIQSGGAYQATVDQPPAEMGVHAIRALVEALTGKPYLQTYELVCNPVDITNVDDFIARKTQGIEIDDDDALTGINLNGVKVGLSVMSLTNPFFVQLVDAVRVEADRFGLELIVNEPKQVLGVLAAQSNQAGGLGLEDQLTLEGLSDQVAVAIQKIRLLDQSNIFRQFAEATGQGLAIATLDNKVTYMNPALLQTLGENSMQDVVGKPTFDYYSEADQQMLVDEVMPQILQTGQWTGEFNILTRQKKVFPAIQNFFLIRNEENTPLYIANVVTDITDRKQGEAELETRLQELSTLQRLMSREEWQSYRAEQREETQGYLYDEISVQPAKLADIEQRQTVLSSETESNPISKNGYLIVKPMAVYGEVIGKLGVYDDPDHPLTPEDQLFLDAVVEQVSEAMERARLLEQTGQSLDVTGKLLNASRRLNTATDLQEAVTAVIEGVSAPDINRAILYIFERDARGEIETGHVTANWYSGEGMPPTPVGTRHPLAAIKTLNFAISRDPFFFEDTFNDPRVDASSMEVFRNQNIRAVASLPMWVGDTQLGTLLVESEQVHRFSQGEMEPFTALVGQLAVAIENRRLFEQTQTTLAEIEATQRQYAVQAWESYRTRTIQQKYEQTRDGVAPLGEEIPAEVTEAVARKQTTAKKQVPALAAGKKNAGDGASLVEGTKSSLTVPLTVRDQIIGVLGMQETDEAREWSSEEIALVEAIAEQMAQAAENIRLLDDTQQRASREQRVNEIGDKIRGAQSLEEALQIAVKEVGLSLQAPQTKVKLSID